MSKFNLNEGLGYKDLAGMMKSTIYIDDFSSKMGDDDEIVVASFYVRDRQAAVDLINWFEKGLLLLKHSTDLYQQVQKHIVNAKSLNSMR